MSTPTIIAVGYNRPQSLARLLASLSRAEYDGVRVPLIISIDKADNAEVEEVAKRFDWPHGEKQVVMQPVRLGLREHILQCGDRTAECESVIVLEDDLYVSPLFYRFAQQTLDVYGVDKRIGGISLYAHSWNVNCFRPFIAHDDGSDVFFMQFAQSWGQVWNRRMWQEFRTWYHREGKHYGFTEGIPASVASWPSTSWLKYHIAFLVENNKYFVYPRRSLTTNFTDVGQHSSSSSSDYQVPLAWGQETPFHLAPLDDHAVVYDVFFERVSLGSALGCKDSELCVDLYGTKGNRDGRRYWLTMERCDCVAVKTFRLALRPHEMNVVLEVPGRDVFLYDTSTATPTLRHARKTGRAVGITKACYDLRFVPRPTLILMMLHHIRAAILRKTRQAFRR